LTKAPKTYIVKKTASLTSSAGIATCRWKTEPYLSPSTKINSKWIRDLTVRPETLKLEKNVGETRQDIGIGNDFLNRTPIAQKIRRIDK
jgi:hypothetical protein